MPIDRAERKDPNGKNAQQTFEGNFSVWVISTKSAPFKARLQASDLGIAEREIDDNVNLGTKEMISDKDRIYLNSTASQVQNFMRMVGRRFFGRGLYAIPDGNILACQEGLNRIREAQKDRVEEFLTRYPEEREAQTQKHPNLLNERWPTPDEIRSFYRLTWKVFQVSALATKATDPQDLINAKLQFQKDLTKVITN
jgi:hypothetical protein